MSRAKGLWRITSIVSIVGNVGVEVIYLSILLSPLIASWIGLQWLGTGSPKITDQLIAMIPSGPLSNFMRALPRKQAAVETPLQNASVLPENPVVRGEQPIETLPKVTKVLTEEEMGREAEAQRKRLTFLRIRREKAQTHEPLYPKLDLNKIPENNRELIQWATNENIDQFNRELDKLPEFCKYYYQSHRRDGIAKSKALILRGAVSDMFEKAKAKGLPEKFWGDIDASLEFTKNINNTTENDEVEETTYSLLRDLRDLETFVTGAKLHDDASLAKAQAELERKLRKRDKPPTPLYQKWVTHRESSRDTDGDQRRLQSDVKDTLEKAVGRGLPDNQRKEAKVALARAKDAISASEITDSLYELLSLLQKLEEFSME